MQRTMTCNNRLRQREGLDLIGQFGYELLARPSYKESTDLIPLENTNGQFSLSQQLSAIEGSYTHVYP